jgi:hypothetical protein
VRERASRHLHDPRREVAQAAARQQGRTGEAVRAAVAGLGRAAGLTLGGREAERWQKTLHGLPEVGRQGAVTLAERLGIELDGPAQARWAEILGRLPAWARQAERSPAEELAARFGIELSESERTAWAGMLERVPVYHDREGGQLRSDPELLAPLRTAVAARCPEQGTARIEAEITLHAHRQQQPHWAEIAGLEPAETLARWVGRGLAPEVEREIGRLLPRIVVERDAQGHLRGRGPEYERALSLVAPDLQGAWRGRLGEELSRQAERVQLRALAPADALARSLGIAWSDARERAAAVAMLRGIELERGGEGPPRGQGAAFEQASEELRRRSGAGRPRVEAAISQQAARQQGRDRADLRGIGRRGFQSLHRTLSAEARRAEASSELGRMRAQARAEARAAAERRSQMGMEEER